MADALLADTLLETWNADRFAEVVRAYGTHEKAARLLHTTRQTVMGYTTGKVSPRFSDVALLARETGYSLEWIATGEGPRRRADVLDGRAALVRDLEVARGAVVVADHRALELGTVLRCARRTLTSGLVPGASESRAVRVLLSIIDRALRGDA